MIDGNMGDDCHYYQRKRVTRDDMTCSVASPSPFFLNLVKALGVSHEIPGDDEWELEDFLGEVNFLITNKLGLFNVICLDNEIPMMYIHVYTNGKEYWFDIRWGMTFYPSMSKTSAMFDWILDFDFGFILNAEIAKYDGSTVIIPLSIKEFADFEIEAIKQIMATISELSSVTLKVEVTE